MNACKRESERMNRVLRKKWTLERRKEMRKPLPYIVGAQCFYRCPGKIGWLLVLNCLGSGAGLFTSMPFHCLYQ